MRLRAVLLLVGLAACAAPHRFGRVVTAVSVSPDVPGALVVSSCDLTDKAQGDLDRVHLADCKRAGVPRSPILPVPVADVGVPPVDGRVVTAIVARDGGGATVTTCRIGSERAAFALLDCIDTAIATAPVAHP